MFRDKKVIVVMPAYNAAKTLRQTYTEVMDQQLVDLVILVDDGSKDDTPASPAPCRASRSMSIPRTKVTAATRKPATASPWKRRRTSSS